MKLCGAPYKMSVGINQANFVRWKYFLNCLYKSNFPMLSIIFSGDFLSVCGFCLLVK